MPDSRTLIIGSDPSHAARILQAWRAAPEHAKPCILTLDIELEWLLAYEGIPFESAAAETGHASIEQLTRAQDWVHDLLRSKSWRAFHYREVPVLRAAAFSLEFYLLQAAYYACLLSRVTVKLRDFDEWLVCASESDARPSGIVLTRSHLGALIRAARWVAAKHAIQVSILDGTAAELVRMRASRTSFAFLRTLFGICVSVVNSVMSLLPRRRLRMLVSEDWKNIRPFMRLLPEVELFLLDRMQIRQMRLRDIIRHRMRFVHLNAFMSVSARRSAQEGAEKLRGDWESERAKLPLLVIDGHDLTSLATEALDTVFTYWLPEAVLTIENAWSAINQIRPQRVLLRASVSSQSHFPILGLVARAAGIPGIEQQHGIEYLGSGSVSREHTAEYIATYGPLVQQELEGIGYARQKLPLIGSPRFDAYQQSNLNKESNHSAFTALVLAPDTIAPTYDSYEIFEYYRSIAAALTEIPAASAILKLRPTLDREAFHRKAIARAFASIPHRIFQYESMNKAFQESDVVITPYSTVVLEAFMVRVPVILAALTPNEQLMSDAHFGAYADAGALILAHSRQDISNALTALITDPLAAGHRNDAAQTFLKKKFSFDGKSSERMRSFLLHPEGAEGGSH